MKNAQKALDFINWFEDVLRSRPGMLGSVADISAMCYVVDNMRNILLHGECLPQNLTWNDFLIKKKLLRDLKPIPIEDNWSFEQFVELRHQYLLWINEALSG